MNPFRLLMVLCLSLSAGLYAQSQSGAREAAESFFRDKLDGIGIHRSFRFVKTERHGDVWVFECGDPAGFVLVKNAPGYPVAGYSTANRLSRDGRIPGPANRFLEALAAAPPEAFRPLKSGYRPVEPMLRTIWSQEGFFNYYCPEDLAGPDGHVYAGCAAVAMGQIIRFYGKFNDFNVSDSFTDPAYGTLSATVAGFDWTRMENRPVTVDTEVARLLYGLGVLVHMNFGTTSSTTSNYSVYDAFKRLKYFNAIRLMRSGVSPEEWLRNFVSNIQDFRPVYVSGSSHSFVCDGMDAGGFFHFNLGWYGYGDGYYPLNQVLSLDPAEAMFDLTPYTNNLPPSGFRMDTLTGERLLRWEKNRFSPVDPLFYRVYINDTTWFETYETNFNTAFLPAGNHELMVSAFYPQGESCWVGPIRQVTEGPEVMISDPALKLAMVQDLVREGIAGEGEPVTANRLSRLSRLEIRTPVSDLTGIEMCTNLQVLVIAPGSHTTIDLEPAVRLNRLKWIELSNIDGNIGLLANNRRLIHLSISGCRELNPEFLTRLTELQELELSDLPLTGTQVIGNLKWLRKLTLKNCGITGMAFVQDLTTLESLDLSGNQLTRFRLNDKLPELADLNISHNQLTDLFFLDYIPGMVNLNIGWNQINRFVTGLYFNKLQILNIENNLIDSVSFVFPVPTLRELIAGTNRIRNIGRMNTWAPGLTRLDLSGNRIRDMRTGGLQKLTYLDISDNQIDLADDLTAFPLLEHADVSSNRIADLFPLYDHQNAGGLKFLDVRNNPLSAESFANYTPDLRQAIDTLYLPDGPEPLSPGNPVPGRHGRPATGQVILGWETAPLPGGAFYELLTGTSRDSLATFSTTTDREITVDARPDKHFYWRVRTVLPDTIFISGLFHFVTARPLSLPYEEDFEDYTSFAYFTEQSPYWLKASSGTASQSDGRIDPYRRFGGKQAIKLANSSDIRLPLDHLYQSSLYITMQVLIGSGCMGSVQFKGLNGAVIALWFKSNGRCDVMINGILHAETPYPVSAWFPLQLNLYGQGNGIWLKIGSTLLPVDWEFTGKLARLDEIELASRSGPNWPTDGQPLFHVDDLTIKATGSLTTGITPANGELQLYPNPATDIIHIEIPDSPVTPVITLTDLSGRTIGTTCLPEGAGRWQMSTSGTTTGIYLVRVVSAMKSYTRKILISK